MPESKSSPRRISAKEKQRQAVELRIAGVTFDVIAQRLGYQNRQGAYEAVKVALLSTLQQPAAELRALDADRLDKLTLAIWPKALQGDLACIDRCLRIFSQRARLLGYEVAPEPGASGQQLLPGQREVIMRVVYDSPPQLGGDLLESTPVLLELEAHTNGDSPSV